MVNIASVDLRLLLVFNAVMAERNVTRAARRLGLTQPAVSNALTRLRFTLKDDLFLRGVGGMQPTSRALELAGPVGRALTQLESAIQPFEFVPAHAERVFRVAMSSHAEPVILPPLIERLRRLAPGIALHVRPKAKPDAPPELDTNEIDFSIGVNLKPPRRLSTVTLYQDRYVAIMHRSHRLARGKITLKDFVAAPHLLISSTGESANVFDYLIARRKLHRHVAATASHLSTARDILLRSDLVAPLFGRTAAAFREGDGGALVTRPLPLEPLSVALTWHPGLSNHPAHEWLRRQIYDVCAPLRAR